MSTESPKPDRSRWFVPIIVATIAAAATVVAALAPFLLDGDKDTTTPAANTTTGPRPAVPPRKQPGTPTTGSAGGTIDHTGFDILISSLRTADLDRGYGVDGDQIPDIRNADTAVAANANSSLALLALGEAQTLEACRTALTERGTDNVPAAEVQAGSGLCVKTTKGLIGVATIEDVDLNSGRLHKIQFKYVVWSDRL